MQQKSAIVRVTYLDALRLLCSFLVIVNHTYHYGTLSNTSSFVRFTAFSSMFFSKIAVPIFLMISGCTLLTKQDDIKKTFSRILRVGFTLVVFSFVYELYHFISGQTQILSIKRFLSSIYEWHITTAYWYLYMYLGLLLMMPFLQKLFASMQNHDFLLFFSLSLFFFSFWPIIVEYTSVSAYNMKFDLPLFSMPLCYLFIGGYLYKYSHRNPPTLLCLFIIAVCSLSCAAVTTHTHDVTDNHLNFFLDNIFLLPIVLSSVCVFFIFRRLHFPDPIAHMIHVLGSASFGIFLLGDLFISLLYSPCSSLWTYLSPNFATLLFQITVWLSSLVCSLVLRRIPLLQKLL